jgi:dihydrofolate reductase
MNSTGKVVLTITKSLNGFVAGPNANPGNPLGDGGSRLPDWIFKKKTDADVKILEELMETSGAVIVGGRTDHDAIDNAWGGVTPFSVPAAVLTKRIPKESRTGFSFVREGIEAALFQVKSLAGNKNVWIMGGANVAPVLFLERKRLFEELGFGKIELTNITAVGTPGAVHLKFGNR